MAATEPSLLDPDKFGLLIQCRQKMDKLNSSQLLEYAQSVLSLLSPSQLKTILFVGCNSIRNHIEYHQLCEMKSSINQIIEQINKEKRVKNKQKPRDIDQSPIAITIIPKNASLTKHIPSDIISNNICHFLKMSSITNLAQCDRQLAVICHTPTSICNLMHRYDPYRYNPRDAEFTGWIDGDYYNMQQWRSDPCTMHRFKNVKRLSISMDYFDRNAPQFTTMFSNLKHLSIIGTNDHVNGKFPYKDTEGLSLLQSICFVNVFDFVALLHIIKPLAKMTNINEISFVDSHLSTSGEDLAFYGCLSEYKNIVDCILPLQPNNLQIIRLQCCAFKPTDAPAQCQDVNDQFEDLERIQSSLSSLKGFVYSEHYGGIYGGDPFFHLAINIISNISSFKRLESVHLHCLMGDPALLASFLDRNNVNALNQISELCISVSIHDTLPLRCLHHLLPKLKHLCVVISISENDYHIPSTFEGVIADILRVQSRLRVFQMVVIMDESEWDKDQTCSTFCEERIAILNEFLRKLVMSLNALQHDGHVHNQALELRLHVKSLHGSRDPRCDVSDMAIFANTIQNLILNYLMSYPLGNIQVKLSWNVYVAHNLLSHASYLKALAQMIRVEIKEGGTTKKHFQSNFYTDMDFKQYAICASNKNAAHKHNRHQNKWKVDCRYCCNTPWV
eukprot:193422_1